LINYGIYKSIINETESLEKEIIELTKQIEKETYKRKDKVKLQSMGII